MEDSKNALFVEPNAYINHFSKKEKTEVKPIKKVVFSEPYDCMPTFHINNNFEKGCCDCVPNKKEKDCNKHNHHRDWNCNNENIHQNHDCNCNQNHKCDNNQSKPNFGFDIKNLMPILNSFNKGGIGGLDLNNISSLFSSGGGFDFSKLISNPQLITSVMSMFANKKKTSIKKEEIICTDYEIKNYTRV